MAIDVLVKNDFQKTEKTGLRDRGMVTAGSGQKRECWRLLSIKFSFTDGRRTPANCCFPNRRIAANTMARNGRGRIHLFNVWRRCQDKKNLNLPLPFHVLVFAAMQKATILTPASVFHENFPWLVDEGRRLIVAFRIAASTMVRNGRGRI